MLGGPAEGGLGEGGSGGRVVWEKGGPGKGGPGEGGGGGLEKGNLGKSWERTNKIRKRQTASA